MLRFPNPGSTISNFVAVYTAAFKALNGRVVGLDDIVRAVVNANLATSSGYVGEEAVNRSTREDRSRDPLYNQMKIGLVTYLCRPRCSFRPLGVRMPRGFCLPMLSADGAGYRSR